MIEKTLDNYNMYLRSVAGDAWNGSKFSSDFGPIDDFAFVDYWTLRKRSLRLFRENMYAKGIIRRLIWNEIHTGIVPQPVPAGAVIWPTLKAEAQQERAVAYGEKISREFTLYADTAEAFSYDGAKNFWQFQELVRFESLICGDGIIICRFNKKTNLPYWQWVNGDNIRTPDNYDPPKGNYIKHGVERNSRGEKVAFHVRSVVNGEVSFERVPCFGEKSKKPIAWMVYGSETLIDDTRGEPFLADTLYMLKDLDRYRDAETRAAVVNAMLAFFIKRGSSPTIASPLNGLATRVKPGIEPKGYMDEPPKQEIKLEEPGTVYDNLLPGDDIISPNPNRPNVNYATFENAILSALAWAHGIPPEILMLKFGNNYSASRQANNEFEVYLARQTKKNADDFCHKIYKAFLEQAALRGLFFLPGFVTAFAGGDWRFVSAWESAAWIGLSRPSVDREKEVSASQSAIDNMLSTFDLESRRISGMSFSQVLQTQRRERDLMAKMGLVPHVDEDNNGKPAYGNVSDVDGEDSEETAAAINGLIKNFNAVRKEISGLKTLLNKNGGGNE